MTEKLLKYNMTAEDLSKNYKLSKNWPYVHKDTILKGTWVKVGKYIRFCPELVAKAIGSEENGS